MTQLPPDIGYAHENLEPQVCAVTGRPVRGIHAVTFGLRDGYYYRVLNVAIWQRTPEFHQDMLAKLETALASDKPKTTKAVDKAKEA